MFTFDVTRMFPRFILLDKNGYALAMAIRAGMQKMNDIVSAALETSNDVDAMPEWRLDELAEEYGILYDSLQSVEIKRRWIKNALETFKRYGTKSALSEYLSAVFDDVKLQEWTDYEGSPYHFRVEVNGDFTPENRDLIYKAVETVGNVRSVFDGATYSATVADAGGIITGAGVTSTEIVSHVTLTE